MHILIWYLPLAASARSLNLSNYFCFALMPPPSATPGTLSSLNTQNSLEINACRWSWCRLTFLTNAELIHHVINDHVYTAIPIRRMDIPILKRAEEGIGESLSLTGFGMFAPNSNDASERLKSRKEGTHDIHVDIDIITHSFRRHFHRTNFISSFSPCFKPYLDFSRCVRR